MVARLSVRTTAACRLFPSGEALPSTTSAGSCLPLFGRFLGTTASSDFSSAYMLGVRLLPSRAGPAQVRARVDLPGSAQRTSPRAQGLRLREVLPMQAIRHGTAREGNSRTPSVYADEKSDEAVVPRKRPNKGRQLPAEVVEGRASPEGNSRQAAVVRTLSRDTTSIRLAAVRRSASGFKPRAGRRLTRGRSPVR